MDTVLRHPGDARVTTTRPGDGARAEFEIWISDGDLVRTYSSTHRLGTQRPIRNRPRGLDDRDFPGPSKIYEPITFLPAETLPDTFVHPAGYCQNVLATGRCQVTGTDIVSGREAITARVRSPADHRARGRSSGLPHLDRGRSRDRGHPPTRRDDRRDRHARRARSSSSSPTGRSRPPPSTSSSPPGRRCSTEPGNPSESPGRPYHRPSPRASSGKEGQRPTRARKRGTDGRRRPPSGRSPRHPAHHRVSRAAPQTGCSRRSGRPPDDRRFE